MDRLRILFLAADPGSMGQVNAGREAREIRERLRAAEHRDAIELVERFAVRPGDLQRAFFEVRPHVVHFSGHGTEGEALVLEGDDGGAEQLGKRALTELFRVHNDTVRLVVLSACHSRPQIEAISEHVECAIGMRRAVGARTVTEFSAALYLAIGFGASIAKAFESAVAELRAQGNPEDRTPQLVVRPGTDATRVILLGSTAPMSPAPSVERGVVPGELRAVPAPFPGLECFDEDRAAYFFGREAEIGEALAMLGGASPHRRWLQIDGPSGAGKSSFARAGLVPAVRERGITRGPKSFWIAVLRPGPDPIASLARALRASLPRLSAALASDEIEERLRVRATALRGLLADHAEGRGVLVLVDQFEEAFTLAGADRAAVERFDALLDEALADVEGPLYLVTTVRSDFTGRMGELPALEKRLAIEAGRYYLRAMGRDALRRAIEEPAKRAGLVWTEGLAERIVEDAAASPGALPLMAHALFAVWSARRGRTLLATAYDTLGGVGGALARSADEIVTALGKEGAEKARRLLLRLVKIGRGSEDTRQSVARAEALAAAGGGREAELVLSRLSGGRDPERPESANPAVPRLVVVSDGAQGERVDLVHEALIQRWETLKKWLGEERRELELRDDIEEAARIWEANGAEADSLPKGRMLRRFREVDRAGLHPRAWRFLEQAEEAERRANLAQESHRLRERDRDFRVSAGPRNFFMALVTIAISAAFWFGGRGKAWVATPRTVFNGSVLVVMSLLALLLVGRNGLFKNRVSRQFMLSTILFNAGFIGFSFLGMRFGLDVSQVVALCSLLGAVATGVMGITIHRMFLWMSATTLITGVAGVVWPTRISEIGAACFLAFSGIFFALRRGHRDAQDERADGRDHG